MFCNKCGAQMPDRARFCNVCGNAITQKENPVRPVAEPETALKTKKPGKKKSALPIVIAAVVLVAVAAVIAIVWLGGGKDDDTVNPAQPPAEDTGTAVRDTDLNLAMYIRDENVYYSDFSEEAPYQVTEDLESDSYNGRYLITEDGKKLFYIDDGDTLFYRSTSDMKKDPVELDSKISRFWVSEDGKLVTYIKNGDLYQHDLEKEEKIAKNVDTVRVSDNGKIIYYTNNEGDTICWNNGKEEEIDDNIFIVYYSEDFKNILYTDDDEILSKKVGEKAKEIISDYAGTSYPSTDGTFYYWTYPEADMEDYFDDKDLNGEMGYLCTLYYYNGSSSMKIADNAWVGVTVDNDSSSHVGVCYTQFGKVEEGELDYDELEDLMEDDLSYNEAMIEYLTEVSGNSAQYIAMYGKTAKVSFEEDVYNLYLSNDGKTVFALVDVDDGEGTLLKASVSDNEVKAFKEVDSSVKADLILGYITNGALYGRDEIMEDNYSNYFVYFKDVKDGHGELFVNGESVADDVYASEIRYNVGENAIMYYVDYEDGEGTLMMYNGEESVEIASDVSGYIMHEDGDIAFTTDADEKSATLCVYTGKVKKVATDVYDYYFTAGGEILYLADYENGKSDLGMYDGEAKIIDKDVTQVLNVYDCGNK